MDFFLFILVNAALFIRPGELISAVQGWQFYNYIIILNLIVAAPAISNELTQRNLSRSPITVCVFGVFIFSILSLLAQFEFENAWNLGIELAKVIAYFLLLMGTVTTPRRFFILLATIASCTLLISLLAMLDYHGVIEIAAIEAVMEDEIGRMRGTGIFGDPNDLAMIIAASIMICVGGLFCKQLGFLRIFLVAPIGLLGYALMLTHSRGGLLALLVGAGAAFYARFGLIRAGILCAALIPVLLAGFAGRQSDFSGAIHSGTGRSRVELWADGLEALKASPLVGIGANHFASIGGGHVAHNSFVSAFTELGLMGGAIFLSLFCIAGWIIWKTHAIQDRSVHPGLQYLRPYLIGMLTAYFIAMMGLSRCYELPTYLMAGCGALYGRLATPRFSPSIFQFNSNTIGILGLVSCGFLIALHLYVKTLY